MHLRTLDKAKELEGANKMQLFKPKEVVKSSGIFISPDFDKAYKVTIVGKLGWCVGRNPPLSAIRTFMRFMQHSS